MPRGRCWLADGRTPLMVAAEGGCAAAARYLLRDGAVVGDRGRQGPWHGRTALHVAAECGHGQVLRVLLSRATLSDLTRADNAGDTCLHVALRQGPLSLCARLLKRAFLRHDPGRLALVAYECGDTRTVSEVFADPGRCAGRLRCMELAEIVCRRGDRETLLRVIPVHLRRHLGLRRANGDRLLRIACERGEPGLFEDLVEFGARPTTVLGLLDSKRSPCVARVVLEFALMGTFCMRDADNGSALCEAIVELRCDVSCMELVLSNGYPAHCWELLMGNACLKGLPDVVRLLLAAGGDPNYYKKCDHRVRAPDPHLVHPSLWRAAAISGDILQLRELLLFVEWGGEGSSCKYEDLHLDDAVEGHGAVEFLLQQHSGPWGRDSPEMWNATYESTELVLVYGAYDTRSHESTLVSLFDHLLFGSKLEHAMLLLAAGVNPILPHHGEDRIRLEYCSLDSLALLLWCHPFSDYAKFTRRSPLLSLLDRSMRHDEMISLMSLLTPHDCGVQSLVSCVVTTIDQDDARLLHALSEFGVDFECFDEIPKLPGSRKLAEQLLWHGGRICVPLSRLCSEWTFERHKPAMSALLEFGYLLGFASAPSLSDLMLRSNACHQVTDSETLWLK